MFFLYRIRLVYWSHDPEGPDQWSVLCGSVWTEAEAQDIGRLARTKGFLLWTAEVALAFELEPNSLPSSVFVPCQIAMSQEDPLAKEFSDLIPVNAYLTLGEAEQDRGGWDDIWEFRMPWISEFALSPFKLETFHDSGMRPHRFTL